MVKIQDNKIDLAHVDLSIIPSLRCNLRCSFCMYESSRNNTRELDVEKLDAFLSTVDFSIVTNVGFYGGEPSLSPFFYSVYLGLVPTRIKKFIITNGTWSLNPTKTFYFLLFCHRYKLKVFVSSMKNHKRHQDRRLLKRLASYGSIVLKEPDEIHPMGRARKDNWSCTKKCLWHEQPMRMAIFPTGDILFQNCDGVYPVIGDIHLPFHEILKRAISIRQNTCNRSYKNLNDILGEQ